ncbi:MAG: alanine racemase [Clostridia bacterium]|nr:alanine racemase [Clostridia bacterium]
MKLTRPVWAEINLDHIAHNIREVRRVTKKDALVTAVIKADAYGHGAVALGQTLLDNGADRFAVATLSEAVQLRRNYGETPILILGYTPSEAADVVIDNDIIQTIYSLDQGKAFDAMAASRGKKVKVHIKLDTGMHRIGFQCTEETVQAILAISKLGNVEIEGIFTHFAVADEVDKAYTMTQVKKYNWVVDRLEEAGLHIPIKHVSNSAAIIDLPELNYNMVRAGIVLYGLYPSDDVKKQNMELREAMSLKAQLSHVKELDADTGISYGLKYKTPSKTKIGTIPIGYADGFTRMYSFKAHGLINGVNKPIVGRICMDQCMIELNGIDAKPGDVVTLFGRDGDAMISIEEVAGYVDTISYEVVCMIDKRVPRVYTKGNEIVKVRDYVLEL